MLGKKYIVISIPDLKNFDLLEELTSKESCYITLRCITGKESYHKH